MTLRRLMKLLVLVAIVVAAFFVHRSLGRYSFEEIRHSALSIPGRQLATALLFVVLSYSCLSMFDALAVRYAGRPLALRRTALASFTALSIGHNVGMAALSSGAVRYRFYTRWGLTGEDVAKVILFCGVTVGLGLAALGGTMLLIDLAPTHDLLGLTKPEREVIGTALILVPLVYLLLCGFIRGTLRVRTWHFDLPPLPLAIGQVVVGTLNFICVATAIQQLLAAFNSVGFVPVATAYVTANFGALISHVPGGLGVLETVMLAVLPGAPAIGALIVFRVLYFFVPLAIGVPVFIVSEIYYSRHRPIATGQDQSGQAAREDAAEEAA